MPAHLSADGRLNLLRAICHPHGLRPYIQNWTTVAGWLIERVHREAVTDGQSDTTIALLHELLAYPDVPGAREVPNWEAPHEPILTVVLAKDDCVRQLFSTITTFGTPHDVRHEAQWCHEGKPPSPVQAGDEPLGRSTWGMHPRGEGAGLERYR